MTATTPSLMDLIPSLLIGMLLGAAYLFLLWKSVMMTPRMKNKAAWLFASSVVRLTLFLFFAVLFAHGDGTRFLAIAVGFITARLLIVNRMKLSLHKHFQIQKTHPRKPKK